MAVPAASADGVPSINELMAANSSFLSDPQGDFDDWIEIANPSRLPVDLGGMYLSDAGDDLTRWQFPQDRPDVTTIPAGGYIVVWADRDMDQTELHAMFKLGADGGELYLVDVDGVTVLDSVEYGPQRADISYGRYPDSNGPWRLLGVPTPGTANVQAYEGFVAKPVFSHERALCEEPFTLTMTCETPDVTIYYTTDGTEPYLEGNRRFPTGTAYKEPLQIDSSLCVRAKAVKSGWKASEIATHTYIFVDQVSYQSGFSKGFPSSWGGTGADYRMDPDIVRQHAATLPDALKSLPTMALSIDVEDLFDSQTGIYANWRNEGESWERAGSIELIHPDGTEGFQSNCGVRIYGGVGRREKKKTFRLLFKGIYGPTKLRYPLFGEEAVDEFDTIILRANFNDGYPFGKEASQYIRDEYCRRLQLALGHPSPHGIFVHLYINGVYWGLYNPVERPDVSFAASYFGGEKEDWDAYNSGHPTNGNHSARTYQDLLRAARSGVRTNEDYQRLQGNNPDGTPNPDYTDYLEIVPYIDFMIANLFVGNTDWPGHNWYGAINRVRPDGFKFFMWDAEWTLWINVGHGLDSDLYENRINVSNNMCEPYARLRDNPEFRVLFGDRVHRAFFNDGPLYVDPINPQWDPSHPERNRPAAMYAELAERIERAMVAESARWGDVHGGSPRTVAHWRAERDRLLNTYMARRPEIVLDQLRSAGLYPPIQAPAFQVNGGDRTGGHIATGEQLAMAGGGAIWYTLDGTDPRLPATASAPQSDETVLVPETAPKRVLVPTGPVSEEWKGGGAFDDSAWTPSTGGPGGVGYDRGSGYQAFIGTNVMEMSGSRTTCYIRIPFTLDEGVASDDQVFLRMRYDDGFIAYLNGTEIARRNFNGEPAWNSQAQTQNSDNDAVNFEPFLVADPADKLRRGPNLLAIHGLNVGTNSSDFLISAELVAREGGGAASDTSPTAARYDGPISLDRSARVKARALTGGTWSALSEAVFAVGPVGESLRISEIMYHPADIDDPNSEFIELTNVGLESIDLHLVRFTDGIDYAFEPFELAPGGYCLLVRDREVFEARHGPGLPVIGQYEGRLDNAGERIELVDAVGQVIQSFEFEDDWYSLTDGLGFSLVVADPKGSDSLNEKAAWRVSDLPGGSPGTGDGTGLP